ncbi:MAG TPA: 50S ribosomal protein L11 methyltransferase [Synechococcales bacterium UBA10510]|nr:50S ribosomal protein L11 methyltransferase [Synechococcales bacterium UBA10510]
MGLAWWRLEMAALPELEESLLWKLNDLGISRVAVGHHPETPAERRLIAWLPQVDWPEQELPQLERSLAPLAATFDLELPPIQWTQQCDEDWSLAWKQHWQPDPVGERLLILPAWLELPPEYADRLVIRMDPGSAFGTGSHPTTRLCLEAIEALAVARGLQSGGPPDLGPMRVADLGCGTGILGLAALLQGASSLAAVDTDSLAVRASRENLASSGVHAAVEVGQGSVETLATLLKGQPADLLLCNILAPVIEALCPAFHTVLAADGVGLLSGLLVDQAPGLQQALAAEGWRAELSAQQGRWGLLVLHKAH